MGCRSYRNKEQRTSKFLDITKFNDIYNNLVAQRKSWDGDEQILETTLKKFLVHNNKKLFKFRDIWRFLSNSLKWVEDFASKEGGLKRTKFSETSYSTSLDAHSRVDLNECEFNLEEVVRLMGQDKEKKRGSSSNTPETRNGDEIHRVACNFESYNLNFESQLNL